jgi:biotin transport system substrate-specific component
MSVSASSLSTVGPSPLARVPAGLKFAVLFAVGILIYVVSSWPLVLAALALAIVALAAAKVHPARLLRALSGLLIIIALVVVIGAFTRGYNAAAMYGVRLLALCLFAFAVTMSTRFHQMLAVFERLFAPVRWLGFSSAQMSLGLSMTVRFIPEIRNTYFEVREAQHARGLQGSPRAVLVPLIARTLQSAQEVALAIDSRCYDSEAASGGLFARRRSSARARVARAGTGSTANTVHVAVVAALIAALGLVPPITLGVVPVPITLQTLGVMLAGALLGPWRGMLACLVVVVLGFAGLPIFAGGAGGLGVLLSPSGGYIVGWAPGALVVGLLVKYLALRPRTLWLRYLLVAISAVLGGIGVVYAFGIPWTSVAGGISLKASLIGAGVFVPGDSAKAVITALVAVTIHRRYRSLLGA